MGERLTKAQRRVLEILTKERHDGLVIYGPGCGVKRSTVVVLAYLGLAQYDPTITFGVACAITPTGRIALAAPPANVGEA